MPICFVSLIEIYKRGSLEDIEELPEETLQSLYKSRENEISNMMEMQFVLAYLGHVSKNDSDEMTWFEINNWFKLIKQQKEIEAKRQEEQMKIK